jgi:hypothetical protein
MHGVYHRLEEDALVLDLRANHDEEAGNDDPGTMQQHAGYHGDERQNLAQSGSHAACGSETVLAGKVAPEQPSAVQWIGREQVQKAQTGLHPNHAAHQRRSRNPRLGKKFDVAAGAQKCCGQHQRRGQICHRTCQSQAKLSAALVGAFLAFRVGIGKHSADGQQKNGAQPQSQPSGHQQPRRLAHGYGSHQNHEQSQAAQNAGRAAQRQANGGQKREKDVDAHLDAHPTAQRN